MIQHTQEASQEEIDRVLARLAQKGANSSTKPVLYTNIQKMMVARNGGYPKHMYHQTMASRMAVNEDQEGMLLAQGYSEHYIAQHYPKFLYRRSLHPKFDPEQRPDLSDEQRNLMNPFIESIQVANSQAEALTKRQKVPQGCSPWADKIDDIEPLPDDTPVPQDALEWKIANLEGALEEARRAAAAAVKPLPVSTGTELSGHDGYPTEDTPTKKPSTRFAPKAPAAEAVPES